MGNMLQWHLWTGATPCVVCCYGIRPPLRPLGEASGDPPWGPDFEKLIGAELAVQGFTLEIVDYRPLKIFDLSRMT